MTIIMGMTLHGAAVIAADTLRHNAINNAAAGNSDKTRKISERVIAAKGGYGPDADPIWNQVSNSGVDGAGPTEVARRIRHFGEPIYEMCKRKAEGLRTPDPGLFFLVAGLEDDGSPSIHWLNFSLKDFGGTSTIGCPLAFASRPEANANASQHARRLLKTGKDGRSFLQVDTWARDLAQQERVFAPHAIGFPLILRLVTGSGVSEIEIDQFSQPTAEGLRRVA